MGKQRPIDLSGFDEIVKTNKPKELDLSGFDEIVKKKEDFQRGYQFGSKPLSAGSKPSQTQVDTKAPSVLLSDEQKQQREKQRIGERFETTLLNVPTEFGKVDQFMRSAKKVQDTLPQVPTIKPSTGGMVVIPQGEKIGDSLRKGDTLQDELTDKLTGKKTALQKQIESAQEAFRTVQGEDVYGEIQDAQQLDNMSPERVEAERERKGNYVKFLYNQFLDGTGSAVSGLVDVALAIDKGMPLASPLSKSGLILDYYRKNNAKGVRNFLRDNIGAEVDKGLEAKYNEGMLTGAIGGLASSAPAMLTGGMTKGLSMVAQMYDGAIQSIESRPDADQWDNDTKTLFAGTLGLIQGQLEKYGLDKVLKGGELTNVIFKKILKSAEGKKITGNILENLIDENVKGVARVFAKGGVRAVDGFASEFYTGAGQEASAIGIESLFDKVTGKPIFDTSNKTNWIGFVDRIAKAGFQEGIGGFALGGGVGMLSGISKKKVKEAQTVINEIDKQLENPDTLPEVAEVLIQRKADAQTNIDDIVDEEADNQSKMSSEDFVKSQELSKQIEKIDLALQDPNTGESVKADLESQKKAIESEIDEIIKKKPPIEPPATGGAGVEARIQEIESLLSSDNASMQETGSGNLIKEGREELVLELAELKKKSPVAGVVKPQGKQDAKKADYTKRIEKKIANASEEKNPIKKALILYEALDSATRVDTGQKENVQELLNAHLAESGLKIENVEIGTKYNETNTSLDATIAGDGIENLKVIEVLSPIIRDANGVIVKQGKVIVESSDNKKTPQVAKPTFDTEEQIIAEGQQAEADFQATDDLVTYEQKMKELEDRAKNLVPAPKDAEIGKPEEVVEVEPIRQLGTGANVYFETEKYRVNDGLKNGNVLLNIQSKTSEAPIANIEFDNANDAVIIAQELNDKFPDGVPDAILIDKYIEQLKNDLLKPQEDAVQVETAGQVPVLTEAPVGEEVEQGKPQPKAKDVAEEGVKAEEVGGDEEPIGEIVKPKSIRLNFSEEGLAKMEGLKAKDVYPTRQFFKNKSINVGLPDVGSPQFDPFISENKDNTKEEIVDLSEITPTQELVDKSGIGGKLTIGNPLIVRFNDGLFVLDGHHRISTEAFRGNTKIKADVITIDKTSKEWNQEKDDKWLTNYYRAEEQAELKAAIPNADQYLTDGKVDRAKITDAKDLKKFDEIYDKYDKLITPLLPKSETKAGSVGVGDGLDYVRNKFSESESGGKQLSDKESKILNKEVDRLIERAEKENGVKRNELKQATWKTNDGYTITEFFENGSGGTRIITPKGEEINLFDNKYKSQSGQKISYFPKAHKAVEQSLKETPKAGGDVESTLFQLAYRSHPRAEKAVNARVVATGMSKLDALKEYLDPYASVSEKGISRFEELKNQAKKAVEQSLKETPKAEPTPAKPKTEPRLKPRVETRLKFTKAIELFNDISATKGGAKKRTLSSKRRTFLEQNPSIKYIDDNWKSISKQLEDKGLLKKEGNCP